MVSFYASRCQIPQPAKLTMLHRILSIVLIGATILGPSVCCCTLNTGSAALSESPCCCQPDDSPKSCSTNSDGDKKHDCPCRKHGAVGARLDDTGILPGSPLVKWLFEHSETCLPALFLSADETPPQRMRLPPCRFIAKPAGTEILIAHSVRRC